MAEGQSKIDAAAKKASADAARKATDAVDTNAVAAAIEADEHESVKPSAVAEAVAAETPAETFAAKPAAKKALAKKPTARKASAKSRIAASRPADTIADTTTGTPAKRPTVSQLKEKIMATINETTATDYTATAKDMASQVQTRAKAAFEKGSEMTAQVTDFHKGNIEALVESGKILASGMQDMGRTYVEEAKTAAETVQDDVKKMAAIKSPTEFFQLQGEIARRNFDAMVATTSKNAEMMMKLANEAFAPLSSRASVAAEKFSKAA